MSAFTSPPHASHISLSCPPSGPIMFLRCGQVKPDRDFKNNPTDRRGLWVTRTLRTFYSLPMPASGVWPGSTEVTGPVLGSLFWGNEGTFIVPCPNLEKRGSAPRYPQFMGTEEKRRQGCVLETSSLSVRRQEAQKVLGG